MSKGNEYKWCVRSLPKQSILVMALMHWKTHVKTPKEREMIDDMVEALQKLIFSRKGDLFAQMHDMFDSDKES